MNPSPIADGPLLDTVLLRTFLEIVDSGSFATAAERLALTPSAVTGTSGDWNRSRAPACWRAPRAAWN